LIIRRIDGPYRDVQGIGRHFRKTVFVILDPPAIIHGAGTQVIRSGSSVSVFGSHCRNGGGIHPAAQTQSNVSGPHAIPDSSPHEVQKLIDSIFGPFAPEGFRDRKSPVPAALESISRRPCEDGCRRKFPDFFKSGSLVVHVGSKEKKVGNGNLVDTPSDAGMPPQDFQGVADEQGISGVHVVEWFDTEVIPGTKQLSPFAVPDCKRKIPKKMIDTFGSPSVVGVQNQFGVRDGECFARFTVQFQTAHQPLPIVDTCISGDPDVSIQTAGLAFSIGLECGFEQCVAETDTTVHPYVLSVRPAKCHRFGHPLQL